MVYLIKLKGKKVYFFWNQVEHKILLLLCSKKGVWVGAICTDFYILLCSGWTLSFLSYMAYFRYGILPVTLSVRDLSESNFFISLLVKHSYLTSKAKIKSQLKYAYQTSCRMHLPVHMVELMFGEFIVSNVFLWLADRWKRLPQDEINTAIVQLVLDSSMNQEVPLKRPNKGIYGN